LDLSELRGVDAAGILSLQALQAKGATIRGATPSIGQLLEGERREDREPGDSPTAKLRNVIIAAVVLSALVALALPARAADPLPSWNEGATKCSLVAFVDHVTQQGSLAFVPGARRDRRVPSQRHAVGRAADAFPGSVIKTNYEASGGRPARVNCTSLTIRAASPSVSTSSSAAGRCWQSTRPASVAGP
jgi:hypothetical protein